MWKSMDSGGSGGGITVKCVFSVPLRGLHHSVPVGCPYCLYMQYVTILVALTIWKRRRNSPIFSLPKDCVNISICFPCLVSVHRLLVC